MAAFERFYEYIVFFKTKPLHWIAAQKAENSNERRYITYVQFSGFSVGDLIYRLYQPIVLPQ